MSAGRIDAPATIARPAMIAERTTTANGQPMSDEARAFIAGRPVIELWGVLWMLSDARDPVRTGNASQHVCAITPLSDDGTRRRSSVAGAESLTIRGRQFDANSAWLHGWIDGGQDCGTPAFWRGLYVSGGGYSDAYTAPQFAAMLDSVAPVGTGAFPPLTHAERVSKLTDSAWGAGVSAARDAWRMLGPYGADIFRAMSPAELESIAAEMARGFIERARDGH